MRTFIAAATLSVVGLVAAPAAAQFGERARVSFAGERLMGIYIFRGEGRDTRFGLGGPPAGHVYELPRLGLDFFVIDHLSIGGALMWLSHDGDDSTFLLAPRVGYAIDFSHSFGFWPRGGLTFRNHANGPRSDDEVALTIEGMFYGAPAEHFAFIFGPVFDIGMVGDDEEVRNWGIITFGVLGWI